MDVQPTLTTCTKVFWSISLALPNTVQVAFYRFTITATIFVLVIVRCMIGIFTVISLIAFINFALYTLN